LTKYVVTAEELHDQVQAIQHVMKAVMKDGEHFGTIPGCGDKKTLMKSGAEKIMMTFRLANDTDVEVIEMQGGHREYRVKCTLYSPDGQRLGTGIGSCCTMEGKYRFRSGTGEVTDVIVPKAYWDARRDDSSKAAKILKDAAVSAGIEGDRFATKKDENGTWKIASVIEKVEHDNPADFYNTCLKMAKKRALVDATLTTTAASDIFTQDIEDMPELFGGAIRPEPKPDTNPPAAPEKPKPAKKSNKTSLPEPPPLPDPPPTDVPVDPTKEEEEEFISLAKAASPHLRDDQKARLNGEWKVGYTGAGIRFAIGHLKAVIAEAEAKRSSGQAA
jgi:hypothetical protein